MGGAKSKHGSSSNNSSKSGLRYSSYQNNQGRSDAIHKLQRKYSNINDEYESLNQVTEALANAGLESSNLIVGIDFTKSNEWTGSISFNRRNLHDLGNTPNPYEQAISIIGKTLSAFDEDNLIPCYGFGDESTSDQKVFSFYPDNRPCNGFEEALQRYREIVPHLQLYGPTSFAPIIETAISIVDSTGGQYHVLLLIADGQVTRNTGTNQKLSSQERDTINAIVKASNYPLSIVMVGVGDGPWDTMREFDDNIPSRAFDNFQFVNFTEIMSKSLSSSKKETEFALAALMEIPSQYKATMALQLLGKRRGSNKIACLPPPIRDRNSSVLTSKSFGETQRKFSAAPSSSSNISVNDKQTCPVCLKQDKNIVFGCGHQACDNCGKDSKVCPVCQTEISTRIILR